MENRIRNITIFQLLILTLFGVGLNSCKYVPSEEMKEGSRLFGEAEYQAAIEPLSNVLQHLPNSTSARWMRAISFDHIGHDSSCKADLRILLSSESTRCDTAILAANELINIYQAQHNVDSAEKYARAKLKFQNSCKISVSKTWITYEILAKILLRKGDFENALIINDSSLLAGASPARTASLKGRILFLQNKTEEAIEAYSEAIAASQIDNKPIAMDFMERGDLYHQTGKPDSACADWKKVLDLGKKWSLAKIDSFCTGR